MGIVNPRLHVFQRLFDGISIHITELNGQRTGFKIALDLMTFVSCARINELGKISLPSAQTNRFGTVLAFTFAVANNLEENLYPLVAPACEMPRLLSPSLQAFIHTSQRPASVRIIKFLTSPDCIANKRLVGFVSYFSCPGARTGIHVSMLYIVLRYISTV